ncbi:hypothetical protein PISMIDRAFT_677374 [Pisolithus microcarpus 441]|uniref:Uncharacterized protein n=1 Tax=Pisolithus microcarpus 441 TaxID=765257 RepID=A0A0C9ZSC7_9AGAM|nr:hypothetical protein PISMIDRAFT_677374 [Pisolithus microcarpus 441]
MTHPNHDSGARVIPQSVHMRVASHLSPNRNGGSIGKVLLGVSCTGQKNASTSKRRH